MRLHSPLLSLRSAFAVLAALAWGGVSLAAGDEPVYSGAAGSITYRTYCANCHGSDARGEGYIASTLRVPPTDLTRLMADNGGVFPADKVRAEIDGRTEVRAHGSREMPIWGDIFVWPEEDSPERRAHVERKIGELVAFIESIQAPADKR